MKKTIFLPFLLSPLLLSAQPDINVGGDAKVGLIVTGTGNTINTTQIFGKSPEYAELKKSLETLEADIQKKAAVCAKMEKDNLPTEYRDGCRAEAMALNARRDSIQKIETRFREDVIRLAETFSRIEISSERLRLAKKFFDEGKISEADNVLKEKDMAATGDAALAVKVRNDSVLLQTANEFALKAQLKALKMDYDSAQILFGQSRKYYETVDNLWAFAYLLGEQNQSHRALEYYEKALKLARSESEEASLAMNLGIFYKAVQKMAEAEKMYLRSLDIYERLAKANPAQFEPDLARTAMNLGNFYSDVQKMAEAEKMYLRSLDIYERLAKANPAQFEPDLARTAMNLGIFYKAVQKMAEAEKMYLRSLDIRERLAKANPAQFEPDLAFILNNFGYFKQVTGQWVEAQKMYSRGLALRQKAVASGQTYFWPELNRLYRNMAALRDSFASRGDWAVVVVLERERAACMEALSSAHPTAAENAPQDYGSLSWYCLFAHQYPESQTAAEKALSLDPAQNWIRTNLGHSWLLRGEWDKAKQVYEQYIAGEKDPAEAKSTLLKDWDDLEKAGVTHKDMAKARKWVRE